MKTIAWVHDDGLRHWFGDDAAVYVFDDAKLRSEQWGLKRVGFVYECLLELPVEILRGDAVEQVLAFQRENGADGIRTLDTPDPRLREQIEQLRKATELELVSSDEFVRLSGKVDLRRFSRYWTKAERALLSADNLSK